MIIQCPKCRHKHRLYGEVMAGRRCRMRCANCRQEIIFEKPPLGKTGSNEAVSIIFPDPTPSGVRTLKKKQLGRRRDKTYVAQKTANSKPEPPIFFFRRLKLRSKLILAMVGIFIIAAVCLSIIAISPLKEGAEKQVYAKARMLLTTLESSRIFTSKVIKPALYEKIPFRFIVEGMSSSSGRKSIFQEFRQLYPKYYFKLAVPRPRNPVNEPNDFEMGIIGQFRENRDMKQWKGVTRIDGKEHYVVIEPIVAKAVCLRCHSTPEKAPAELNRRYATRFGFGLEKPGDIYGALAVTVPTEVVAQGARKNLMIFIVMVTVFFFLLVVIMNFLFGRLILKPINHLAEKADTISIGELDTEIVISGEDEIGKLSRSFERMRQSVKLAIERLKKRSRKTA